MDFLKDLEISENTIKELIEKYDESIIDVLILDKQNVIDNITYLKRIGIMNVEEILKSHIEIFTKEPSRVIKAFEKYNIKSVVERINIDPSWIMQI